MAIQTEEEAYWYLPQNLTAAQQVALAEFRAALSAQGPLVEGQDSDIHLLRFLKARQWHVEPAVTMYTNMAKWHKEFKVDEIFSDFSFPEFKALAASYPHFYHKTDKYGRPVYIELLGSFDCTKMLEAASKERILQYHVWTWERLHRHLMPACSEAAGRPIITCTAILDCKGLSMKQFTMTAKRLLTEVTAIDQANYPERLGTLFIINAPMVFTAIWSCVAPLLEERTRRKIMVLGTNYLSTLTKLIPIENLPTMFGGKSECRDHLHSNGIWQAHEPCRSKPWFPPGSGIEEPALSSTQRAEVTSPSQAKPLDGTGWDSGEVGADAKHLAAGMSAASLTDLDSSLSGYPSSAPGSLSVRLGHSDLSSGDSPMSSA